MPPPPPGSPPPLPPRDALSRSRRGGDRSTTDLVGRRDRVSELASPLNSKGSMRSSPKEGRDNSVKGDKVAASGVDCATVDCESYHSKGPNTPLLSCFCCPYGLLRLFLCFSPLYNGCRGACPLWEGSGCFRASFSQGLMLEEQQVTVLAKKAATGPLPGCCTHPVIQYALPVFIGSRS